MRRQLIWNLSPKGFFSCKVDFHCHESDLAGKLKLSTGKNVTVLLSDLLVNIAKAEPKQLERLTNVPQPVLSSKLYSHQRTQNIIKYH